MHFSFRVTLFSLMLAVLLTAVILLGMAAFFYSHYAVGNLGGQLLNQVEKRVSQQLHRSLDLAEAETETIEELMANGWINPSEHERVTDLFLASLRARSSLTYLSFGMPDGTYYHAFRDKNGALSVLWLLPQADGKRRLYEFEVTALGERVVVNDIEDSTRTPPFERPYYRTAVDEGKALWTESYVFLGSGESLDMPGVSRAVPVFSSEDKRLMGVLTADFELHALSRFLSEINLGEGGLSFLLEVGGDRAARVIAHPAAAEADQEVRLDLTEASPGGEGRRTIPASEVDDRRVVQFVSLFGGELSEILPDLQTIEVKADGRTYTGGYRHLGREGGPNWIFCILLPDDEVFGDVNRMARLMGLMGFVGVLIAGGLSLVLSRRVALNLRTIAREAREIGHFKFDDKEPVKSRIREISTLGKAVEEMKTGLRSFQKYVPQELVRSLMETGAEAELGGERKELTVFFSDIVGFTSVSEQLDPDRLTALLAVYLEEMSGEILQRGGTVDKYIGDSIMAFWGAPRSHETPALSACRTALANQARLEDLRVGWEQEGLPPLRARIGLHIGEAIVGNFGSPRRLDYTAIGDTVNIASRLEGLNRFYGTEILISEALRDAVEGRMLTRPIDRVAVQGREEGLMVYELLGEVGGASGVEFPVQDHYAEALNLYFKKDWKAAEKGFESAMVENPHRGAAQLMRERCKQLLANPPGADWDGVFHAPK